MSPADATVSTAHPTTLVLLAHGSPDPRHGATMHRLAERVGRRAGGAAHAAFLEHEGPSATELGERLHGPVRMVPLLITPAYHARVDVPSAARELAAGGAKVSVAEPLGGHDGLVRAVAQRLAAAGHDPADGVHLLAGGNSDGTAAHALRSLLAAHAPSTWRGGALTDTHADHHADDPATRLPVLAFTLAEGVLHDRVADVARRRGAPFVPGGLADTGALLDVVLDRAARGPAGGG